MIKAVALQRLVLRADAGGALGTGHIMRSLALAHAWQDAGGKAVFVTNPGMPVVKNRLIGEGLEVSEVSADIGSTEDALETIEAARRLEAAWVVVDGYHFGATYQRTIKESGIKLLFVDDYGHCAHYYADQVLNQNLYADEALYPRREPNTHLLLGSRYALLRREFNPWRNFKRWFPGKARKILITFGGCPPVEPLQQILKDLTRMNLEALEVKIPIGSANPDLIGLQHLPFPGTARVELISSTGNMACLMAWADLAIATGGTTCWELAFMGVPSLLFIIANNQEKVAKGLDQNGIMVNLGWYNQGIGGFFSTQFLSLAGDASRRSQLSSTGRYLVDGLGGGRVISSLIGYPGNGGVAGDIHIRAAGHADALALWELSNDPGVRANSFHPDFIPLDHHLEWYQKKLSNQRCRMWILEVDGRIGGQIRFDRNEENTATVGMSIISSLRSRGLGTRFLRSTCGQACNELGVTRLRGLVFRSNLASHKAFKKAGFKEIEEPGLINGKNYLELEWIK